MPCFSPLQAYSEGIKSNGKKAIRFLKNCKEGAELEIPCGQCIGCRLERSRQWAMRCVHENMFHDYSCFITLTYSDEFLPEHGTLDVTDYQRFMKRLRKKFGNGIRFFHCGEYGDETFRPHYHAILFGVDFTDPNLVCKKTGFFNNVELLSTRNSQKLYSSSFLSELWPFGHASVGNATFESAAYVARYVCKKVTGKKALEKDELGLTHYERIVPDTGEIVELKPEYVTMSRRPGIGAKWFEHYADEAYPSDKVVLRGRTMRPPKYYDYLKELQDPEIFAMLKDVRIENARANQADNTYVRRKVREAVQKAKLNVFKVDKGR